MYKIWKLVEKFRKENIENDWEDNELNVEGRYCAGYKLNNLQLKLHVNVER